MGHVVVLLAAPAALIVCGFVAYVMIMSRLV
jgi:hypothetical protein